MVQRGCPTDRYAYEAKLRYGRPGPARPALMQTCFWSPTGDTGELRELRNKIEEEFPEQPECFVPRCGHLAATIHQTARGKPGDRLMALCPGHGAEFTSTQDRLAWARELGLLVS